ncbi:hypothetical protein SISSUDRAFT_1031947 [Sistotremastrum suecicum HHB10207 ss-3]|uniref:JAB domain-containing protein n=1 Tax=Sistotremastrum suecicum HHB10207 ss-3 TaxID=1314776 RepID=A0A166F899_9AGAM|nr:hypothetical protein SISSUDRAFT_1031947 [Sistotremastrum suecicum HHB10207 ss-3]
MADRLPELPLPAEIAKKLKDPFQKAWNDSFLKGQKYACEQGGFIFITRSKPKEIRAVRARAGETFLQRPSDKVPKDSNPGIDLSRVIGAGNGSILLGTFHTHPLREDRASPYPSDADTDNAWRRQLPGFVIGRAGILHYGLEYREDSRNPGGYPPQPHGSRTVYRSHKVGNRPNNAPYQKDDALWEEDFNEERDQSSTADSNPDC